MKRGKRLLLTLLIGLGTALLLLFCTAGLLFHPELKIVNSIRTVSGETPVYYMEFNTDYHFDEFLESGGASSDQEVSAFLTKCISKGFYSVEVKESGPACSVLSAKTAEGAHLWGRNYDWPDAVPILVKSTPEDGYASISTCDFQNVTGSAELRPDAFANKMLAIASLYVPLDGINEAGLCVADLQVNEGGMFEGNTQKPDLTITTAIRLLLNRCATVTEAVTTLSQYDIHPSGGISHHLAISDASGASVVLEFTDSGPVVIESNFVTNFNMAIGNTSAGGESAQTRFDTLRSVYEENKGMFTPREIKDTMFQVAQSDKSFRTQWTVVYNGGTREAEYFFLGSEPRRFLFSFSK